MMAKIGEVRFKIADNVLTVQYAEHRWEWYCCDSFAYLYKLWDVPIDLNTWAVSLHDCPGKERWEMRIEWASSGHVMRRVLKVRREGGWEMYFNRHAADDLLRVLPQRFFVQMEY